VAGYILFFLLLCLLLFFHLQRAYSSPGCQFLPVFDLIPTNRNKE